MCLLAAGLATPAPRERAFEVTYEAEAQAPEGARELRLWLPYPVSDAHQQVGEVAVETDVPYTIERGLADGNVVLHAATAARPLRVRLRFRVTRREYSRHAAIERGKTDDDGESAAALARWLRPDRLVPLDERVRALAAEVTRGREGDLARGRAIYDHVVSSMSYDKSGTGWGRGDLHYACDFRKGNCTDFHALFIGLARAAGIPAKFAIGLPLPEARGQGEIPGYHCWAEFYARDHGWIPVDTSEARKRPEKLDYFFGAHDENRVQLSLGRDVVLRPPQAGPPLNFFVYPYAEADGEPVEVQARFGYRDLP